MGLVVTVVKSHCFANKFLMKIYSSEINLTMVIELSFNEKTIPVVNIIFVIIFTLILLKNLNDGVSFLSKQYDTLCLMKFFFTL